jgi:hypothetical protein
MTEQDLIDMKLHDAHSIYTNGSLMVTRVPGGWIYTIIFNGHVTTMCFVPLPLPVDVKG